MQFVLHMILQAFGGVVVGFVTKYAGGVVKGFALIAGVIRLENLMHDLKTNFICCFMFY